MKEGKGFILLKDGDPGDAGETPPLPTTDFATFILSLATSALVNLGESIGPDGKVEETPHSAGPLSPGDLVLARQSIDILEMIQLKTRGNLDDDEARLLQSVLYDLRLRFVAANQHR